MAHQTEPNTALANITGQKVYTEPPRHEWTCKNCKYWNRLEPREKIRKDGSKWNIGEDLFGFCNSKKIKAGACIGLMGDNQSKTDCLFFDEGDGYKTIKPITGEDFGCINFEGI